MSYNKPLPEISPESEPFWNAAQDEKLLIQLCKNCDTHIWHPRVVCPYCLSNNINWEEASGSAVVFSYSVVHHPPTEQWSDETPYVNAIVHLDEDVYMFSQIVNVDSDDVEVGMPVSVIFDHITKEVSLPKFEPDSQ